MTVTLGQALVFLGADTEKLDKDLAGAKTKTTSWATNLGGSITTLLGGAVVAGATLAAAAVVGIGAASVSSSSQIKQSTNDIRAELGLTEADAKRLGQVGVGVFKNNFGDSIEHATSVVIKARQQLGDLSDKELKGAAENALRFADVFKEDVDKSLNSARVLMDRFDLSQEQAFDLMASGFQDGLNNSGDFLESISEYGGLFADAGFDADQMFSIMKTGYQEGILGTDAVSDAMKEWGIKANEGGDEFAEAFEKSTGYAFEQVQGFIASGDEAWADYFPNIIEGLNSIDDPLERSQLQVALFGAKAEDLGVSFTEGLSSSATALEDMAGATDSLDAKYDNFGSTLETVKRKALIAIAPIGEKIMSLATQAMPAVELAFDWFEDVLPVVIKNLSDIVQGLIDVFILGKSPLGDWYLMWEAFYNLFGENIADILMGVFLLIHDDLLPALMEFGEWFMAEGLPAIMAFISPIVAEVIPGLQLLAEIALNIASFVLPLLVQWWMFLIENIDIIAPIFAAIAIAILAITSPVTILIGAIVLLATAWANNWGGIQEKTQQVLDFIMPYIQQAMEFIQSVISSVLGAISEWWAAHGESVMTVVAGLWAFVVALFNEQLKLIQVGIETVLNIIQAFWAVWGDAIMAVISAMWENIKIATSAAFDILGFLFDAFAALIQGDWERFGESLGSIWDTAWGAIKSILQNQIDAIKVIISTAIGIIRGKWTAFTTSLKNTWANAWNSMKIKVDSVMEKIKGIIDSVKDTIQDVMDSITDMLDAIDLIPDLGFSSSGATLASGSISTDNSRRLSVNQYNYGEAPDEGSTFNALKAAYST